MSKKQPSITVPWEVTKEMFLSESEVESLLKYVRDCESEQSAESRARAAVDRMIVELLLFSGVRNSELCHLRVVDTIIGHGQSAVQVAGTPKQYRLVYIPRSLSVEIARFVKEVRPLCLPEGHPPNDLSQPLILNERGKPYDRTALYRRVVRILTEAGLGERASVQLLRHTYGFLAYKRTGGNLLFVQNQMGHAHPMVTAVYAMFVEFSYADLADRVGDEAPLQKRTVERRPAELPVKKGTKR